MGRERAKQLILEGILRAKQFQASGKLRISSDSIPELVRTHPRLIDWDRCMKKSLWLMEILESVRIEELAELLLIPQKTVRAWFENGLLKLPRNQERISDLFGDEPVFRFLDKYPDWVDLARCTENITEWFAKYECMKGRFLRKEGRRDDELGAVAASYHLLLQAPVIPLRIRDRVTLPRRESPLHFFEAAGSSAGSGRLVSLNMRHS
jgi:hypothetical protein